MSAATNPIKSALDSFPRKRVSDGSDSTPKNSAIIIDPEFRDLIPALAPAELEQLHKSLDARGCLSPLLVWKDHNILLDGHNRFAYCDANNIPFETREIFISSEDAARNFIILNQLGRRNVSPDVASILRGKLYNARKKEQGGTGANQHKQKDQNDTSADTAATVAKETGVSPATVKRDAKYAEAADKIGATKDILAGKEKRSKKEIVEAAFPKKNLPLGATYQDAEIIAPEEEQAPLVIDGTKSAPATSSCWSMARDFIATLKPLTAWQERQALCDVRFAINERLEELDKLNGKEKPNIITTP